MLDLCHYYWHIRFIIVIFCWWFEFLNLGMTTATSKLHLKLEKHMFAFTCVHAHIHKHTHLPLRGLSEEISLSQHKGRNLGVLIGSFSLLVKKLKSRKKSEAQQGLAEKSQALQTKISS